MAERAQNKLIKLNENRPKSIAIQFDDMETFEHTKCKPLSVTLAVEHKTRWILGFEVSQMPATGLLAKKSLKKYGYRKDLRSLGRAVLFDRIKHFIDPKATIESDQNSHYPASVKTYFPYARHITYKGRDPAVTGQGELKKGTRDPLFSLNHTCATLRARTSRLIRKTWCTTKHPGYLAMHLMLVALHHNLQLKPPVFSTE